MRGGASTGFPSGGASTGLLSGGVWRVSHRVTPLNALLSARTVFGVVVGGSVERVVTGMDGVQGWRCESWHWQIQKVFGCGEVL